MRSQVKPNHYFGKSYDTKERFSSYWHQINEIIKLKPGRVLEIGIGNGFISKYLKGKKVNLITLDINKELNPDVVRNVLNMPFKNESFDIVACYETLEHLDYKSFHKALSEIFRVSKSYAVLSLPDIGRVCRLSIQIPKIVDLKLLIPLPRLKEAVRKFDGEHYWEIGKTGYPLSKIMNDIQKVGFRIKKTYRVFEIPYHRFFILSKIK